MKHGSLYFTKICGYFASVIIDAYDDMLEAGFPSDEALSLIQEALVSTISMWRREHHDKTY